MSVDSSQPPKPMPKGANPNIPPDPERWLPKFERSEFKRKHRKRAGLHYQVGRGTQGSASGAAAADKKDAAAAAPSAPAGSAPAAQPATSPPPSPTRAPQAKQKKKNKGKKKK